MGRRRFTAERRGLLQGCPGVDADWGVNGWEIAGNATRIREKARIRVELRSIWIMFCVWPTESAAGLVMEEAVMSSNEWKAVVVVGILCGPALAGPDWTEVGDAGKSTPQTVAIPVQPESITGTLGESAALLERGQGGDSDGGPDVADLYDIVISEPDEFIATTLVQTFEVSVEILDEDGSPRTGTNFDTALWLFRSDRRGILGNNDISTTNTSSRLLPIATDGTGARIMGAGRYLLAVSFGDVRPVAQGGGEMFNFGNSPGPTQVSGPDGPGGSGMLSAWVPDVSHAMRKYRISIRPAPCAEPCPGDADGDHQVSFSDVSMVLTSWGNICP